MPEADSETACVSFDVVYSREIDTINKRRRAFGRPLSRPRPQRTVGYQKFHNGEPLYDRDVRAGLVGLCLSGGGIRSASFCLGATQALDVAGALKNIDLLSSVSGGGYIASSISASAVSGGPRFPFPSALRDSEPKPLKHIRDHSNFLIPDGWIDVLGSVAVYLRGLVANAVLVLPWLLIFAAVTVWLNPRTEALSKPGLIAEWIWNRVRYFDPNVTTNLFGVTLAALVVVLVLYILWAFSADIYRRKSGKSESASVFTRALGFALIATLVIAFCEAQPYILGHADADAHGSVTTWMRSPVQGIAAAAATGTGLLGFFWKRFAAWVETANQDTLLRKRLLAVAGKIGIYLAGLFVPFLLWLAYAKLTLWAVYSDKPPVFGLWLGSRGVWLYSEQRFILAVYLLAAVILFALSSYTFQPNTNSLHRLYRDRLSKAFLFDTSPLTSLFDDIKAYGLISGLRAMIAQKPVSGDLPPRDDIKLSGLSPTDAPYHLINAALNIQNSKFVNRRGRNADFFVFSRNYVGSEATGYVKTTAIEAVDLNLDLATAMAISGAAASSNMGSKSVRPMTPTLTLLNIRLGYWLRNPGFGLIRLRVIWWLVDFLNLYYFAEMFGLLREDSWSVYLTDGGHVENLGLYELLKRQCKLIIVVDAEADPEMTFPSFVELERYARIDLGTIIDLPWRRIREVTLETGAKIAETGGPADAETRKGPHCIVGQIQYPRGRGLLLYVKASLSGDENDYMADYKRRHDTFPHEMTGDQFFSEEQFEVYRALGFHAMRSFTKGDEEVPTFADRHVASAPNRPDYERPPTEAGLDAIDEIRKLLGLERLRRSGSGARSHGSHGAQSPDATV